MRHSLHTLLASTFLVLLISAGMALAGQVNHVAVLIDASGSYKGALDAPFANRVARDVGQRLPSLGMRDTITIAPLGEYGRNLTLEAQISKRLPPAKARQAILSMIAGFPDAVQNQLGGVQKATNIIGALEKLSRRMNCAETAGHVFVLSDGQETGKGASLPSSPIFKGCASFTMIGVQGETPEQTRRIGAFWEKWCKAAGFRRCDWLS